jgi:hypothetical protein
MMRTCKMLGLQALLFTALAAAPSSAGQIDGPEDKDTVPKQLAELQKSLDSIHKQLQELREGSTTTAVAIQAMKVDINKLRERIDALEKGTATRISGSAPTTASVELVNDYPQPMDFILNQTLYRLRPSETRVVNDVPVGAFTFRVLDVPGYQNTQRRVLTAGKTPYIIRVHPMR